MHVIDEVDKTILRFLQRNARISPKELAARLNLTVSPIYERIKRLEKIGYIKQYVAILNRELLSPPVTTICHVSMRYHHAAFIEKFETEVKKFAEVEECYHMAGEIDFLLKINVPSINDYHEFIKSKLSTIDNVSHINSIFVLKEIKHTYSYYNV